LDGTLKYWHTSLEKAIGTTPKQRTGVTSVVASMTGERSMAAACYQDSTIRFYNLNDTNVEEIKVFDENKQTEVPDTLECGYLQAWSISLAPDGLTIAAGNHGGTVNLYSLEVGHEKIATYDTHGKLVLCTAFSPSVQNQRMACSSSDGSVYIFDVLNQQMLSKLPNHALPARCVKFSPDGNLVYSASDDRQVYVYDTLSGTAVNSFSHAGMALSVDPSQDHRHFCVGTSDGSVALWDLGMQRCEHTYHSHGDQVWGVAYDVKDQACRRFVSVGDDALIQIYE
jgi:WD repeat-containing protein 61